MKVRTAFLSLLTLSFLAILTLVLGTRLLHAADDGNAQTAPYIDTAAAGVPAPSGCSPMFQILDANKDDYVNKAEAKRSAGTTANWKRLDSNFDNRVCLAEFCTGTK